MSEENEKAKTPFYQNIIDPHRRNHVHPPKPGKAGSAADGAASGEAGRSSEGSERSGRGAGAHAGRPRADSARTGGARTSRAADARRDGETRAPRADSARTGGARAPRTADARRDGAAPRYGDTRAPRADSARTGGARAPRAADARREGDQASSGDTRTPRSIRRHDGDTGRPDGAAPRYGETRAPRADSARTGGARAPRTADARPDGAAPRYDETRTPRADSARPGGARTPRAADARRDGEQRFPRTGNSGGDTRDTRGGEASRYGQARRESFAPSAGAFSGRSDSRPRDTVYSGQPRSDRPHSAWPSAEGSGAAPRTRRPFEAPPEFTPVFGPLPKETRALLDAFPEIVDGVMPLDSKKILQLPTQIRDLSHELTDERSDRRVGYLNDPAQLSAYIRYYMWWNLVRLTRLFVSLPIGLDDGSAAVDLGSGPLTLPIALWMAKPELRKKKITWFCVDISQGALAAGEELFLSLAARTGDEPWTIVRVKGECGVSLRRKVSLVASANMFNELYWDNPLPLEAQAKHHATGLESYAETDADILVIEPGVPRSGRFVSLLRDCFLRLGYSIASPCPHEGLCPFPGLRHGKWCHFVFDTADAPARLHKLSEDASLSKDRAALSFVFARRTKPVAEPDADESAAVSEGVAALVAAHVPTADEPTPDVIISADTAAPNTPPGDTMKRLSGMFHGLRVRITSDPIRLPDYHTGRYGCSELGMVMLTGTYQAADWLQKCESGSLVEVPRPDKKNPERDSKTDALVIRLK